MSQMNCIMTLCNMKDNIIHFFNETKQLKMSPQLPFDCLNEIFEHLENDKVTLHSCLLVNRLWCEVAVEIIWRNVWNYSATKFSTLIACLPNESKEILLENGIIILTPTSKPPINSSS